jgi:hypothetical protein
MPSTARSAALAIEEDRPRACRDPERPSVRLAADGGKDAGAEVAGTLARVMKERGLADARLTADDERCAPWPQMIEDGVQSLPLGITIDQSRSRRPCARPDHRPSMS